MFSFLFLERVIAGNIDGLLLSLDTQPYNPKKTAFKRSLQHIFQQDIVNRPFLKAGRSRTSSRPSSLGQPFQTALASLKSVGLLIFHPWPA